MIERVEVTMTNGTVHNFRRGEFGVESIIINHQSGFVEILYGQQEIGRKQVLIPLQNVEKCELVERGEF